MLTAASIAATLPICALIFGWPISVLLAAVVLAHELGHFAAGRIGGVVLFAPVLVLPLGGFVLMDADKLKSNPRAEATVIAAGPVAGGLTALAVTVLCDGPWTAAFVQVSIWLNLVNLLPVGALDGGRLARLVGLPRTVGWVIGAPAAVWNPLLLTAIVAIVPAAALGDRQPARVAARDKSAVRTISGTGVLVAFGLLAAAHIVG